jgi:hypothetical protein
MQRAVDGDHITLRQHLFEILDPSAADFLFLFRAQWLVVKVQELLAIEGFEPAKHTLANATDGHRTHHLVLEVVLVLGHSSNIPIASGNLLVSRYKVTDKGQDGHDNVFCNRDHIGAGDFSNGDTAIGLIGSIEVDMVRANTCSDSNLEVLRLGKTLRR